MTQELLHTLSVIFGIAAHALLLAYIAIRHLNVQVGRACCIAIASSILFMALHSTQRLSGATLGLELLSTTAWILVLGSVLNFRFAHLRTQPFTALSSLVLAALALPIIGVVIIIAGGDQQSLVVDSLTAQNVRPNSWLVTIMLLSAVLAIVMLEQVIRNTVETSRWRMRYLYIGLSGYFAFNILMYACELLFRTWLVPLHTIQPAVLGAAAPLIAIAFARNRSDSLQINVSRSFVFRSGMLIGVGAFLLVLGIFGYYVIAFAGDRLMSLAALLVTLLLIFAVVVLGSTKFRRYMRVVIAKTLYEYKYDYRDEWLKVTNQLTESNSDYSLGQQALRAMMDILHSGGGALWQLTEQKHFVHLASVNSHWAEPLSASSTAALVTFYQEKPWVIDLENPPSEAAPAIEKFVELQTLKGARFIIPLLIERNVFGLAILVQSSLAQNMNVRLNWEDHDILKVIANQSAGSLALQQADQTLLESKQLNAFNQGTAFVIHDLKTISAQQSLLLQNATKHKDNPEFIADMLTTVANSVSKMNALLEQLKDQNRSHPTYLQLNELISRLVQRLNVEHKPGTTGHPTVISFTPHEQEIELVADTARLNSALGHILQNAYDATIEGGSIEVRLNQDATWVKIHVQDTGPGMTENFIKDKLFQPFESTKGLTGMGIGVYQAREYVRSMGGELMVNSEVNQGTEFVLQLPHNSRQTTLSYSQSSLPSDLPPNDASTNQS